MKQKEYELQQHCLDVLPNHLRDYNPYDIERYHGINRTIPDGPWDTSTREALPSHLSETLKKRGCEIDGIGRPLHPWYDSLLTATGVVSGTGKYWHWGPNYTADPVVLSDESRPHILLVERSDNRRWALPGGFVDNNESVTDAGIREAEEETGIVLREQPIAVVYNGVVADERTTAHAWAHTSALLWRAPRSRVVPSNESLRVDWFPVDELPANLHGSHQKIIAFALEYM